MPALHSPPSPSSPTPLLLASAAVAALLLLQPSTLAAQPEGRPPQVPPGADCALAAEDPRCAPDQRLELDAAPPARRFASYSDLVALVRGRVSLGLALAPFPRGALARLRLEAEVVTRLRGPRGVELTARVGALLLGDGLDGLFAGLTGSYLAAVQPGGQVLLGAELGYSRHFASLYVCAAAGASVQVWARTNAHPVLPSVRLLLGHAFY